MKKLLVSFLLGLTVFFSLTPYLSPAKAQTWYNQTFQEWYGKVYDPANPSEIFGERYTAAQVQWIVYGLFGFLINTVTGPTNAGIIQCFISNVANIDTCMQQLSDLITTTGVQNQTLATAVTPPKQSLGSLIFSSNRPISGIAYVRERLAKLSPVSVVQAQIVGVGFNALQPVQTFWKAFRDISFGLFVIVAVVFAFMIMFRVKLSPQTVVSVQSALPKIVISLVLVTFSYAIAGFLIDLMYIVIGLLSIVGNRLIPVLSPTAWFNFLTLGQPIGWNVQGGVLLLLVVYIVAFFFCLIMLLMMNIGFINLAIGTAVTAVVSILVAPIAVILLILALLLIVIAVIVVLWISIKIIWGLLKAFVNILILTIFAPIQLTLGVIIPSLSFGSWVKSYISNLAVFVVTGGMFLISYVFLAQGINAGFAGYDNVWQWLLTFLFGAGQGLTGSIVSNIVQANIGINAWPPLLGMGGGAGVGLLFVVASFVVFTLTPKANQIIQSFMTGKPFAYGSGIGEAFGGVGMAYNQTIGPSVGALRKYGAESNVAGIAGYLHTQTAAGGRFERAPDWIKDFFKTAAKKPTDPYHR